MTKAQFTEVAEDADISQTDVLLTRRAPGEYVISVNIEGAATADYSLDVSADGNTWFEDEETYTGTSIRDTFVLGDQYLRVRVTTAAANGETATVTIQGAR